MYKYNSQTKKNMENNKKIRLKINPKDNTITIKKIKDSWNKEEVEKLIISCYKDLDKEWNWESHAQDFINENL